EEMRAAFHIDFIFPEQSQISLVHQGRRLNHLSNAIAVEITLSQTQQILIDYSEQLFASFRVAVAPLFEKRGERDWREDWHSESFWMSFLNALLEYLTACGQRYRLQLFPCVGEPFFLGVAHYERNRKRRPKQS